jgi:hypothetical protein
VWSFVFGVTPVVAVLDPFKATLCEGQTPARKFALLLIISVLFPSQDEEMGALATWSGSLTGLLATFLIFFFHSGESKTNWTGMIPEELSVFFAGLPIACTLLICTLFNGIRPLNPLPGNCNCNRNAKSMNLDY